jgi:hypothetical protein
VSGRQVGSCWRSYELKGAFAANGRRLSGFSRPVLQLISVMLLFSSYDQLLMLYVSPRWAFSLT